MKSEIQIGYSGDTDVESRLQALEQAVGAFVSAESSNVHDAPEDMDEPPFYMNDGETLEFSFKASIGSRDPVAPETEPVLQIRVSKGYRQVIGGPAELVEAKVFDADIMSSEASVYMTYTLSTDSTAGSWGSLSYGTPDVEDANKRVFIIATNIGKEMIQRHLGDLVVLDIPPVPASKYQVITSGTGSTWNRWISGWVRAH